MVISPQIISFVCAIGPATVETFFIKRTVSRCMLKWEKVLNFFFSGFTSFLYLDPSFNAWGDYMEDFEFEVHKLAMISPFVIAILAYCCYCWVRNSLTNKCRLVSVSKEKKLQIKEERMAVIAAIEAKGCTDCPHRGIKKPVVQYVFFVFIGIGVEILIYNIFIL